MKKVFAAILSLFIMFCTTEKSVSIEVCATDENILKVICKEFLENAQKMGQVCDGIREIRCGLSFFASTWYAAKGLFKEKDKAAGFTRAYQKLEDDVERSEKMDEKLRGISYVLSFFASLGLAVKSLCDGLSSKFSKSIETKMDENPAQEPTTEKPKADSKINGAEPIRNAKSGQNKADSKI